MHSQSQVVTCKTLEVFLKHTKDSVAGSIYLLWQFVTSLRHSSHQPINFLLFMMTVRTCKSYHFFKHSLYHIRCLTSNSLWVPGYLRRLLPQKNSSCLKPLYRCHFTYCNVDNFIGNDILPSTCQMNTLSPSFPWEILRSLSKSVSTSDVSVHMP